MCSLKKIQLLFQRKFVGIELLRNRNVKRHCARTEVFAQKNICAAKVIAISSAGNAPSCSKFSSIINWISLRASYPVIQLLCSLPCDIYKCSVSPFISTSNISIFSVFITIAEPSSARIHSKRTVSPIFVHIVYFNIIGKHRRPLRIMIPGRYENQHHLFPLLYLC